MNFPSKPAPDAVEWICGTYGLDKGETMMIGDRELDVLSGKIAGVYGSLFTRKENVATAPDFIIGDIAEVTEVKP